MLNERGGIVSDLVALRLATDHYRLFVGTTAIKRDMAWLRRMRANDHDIHLTNRTEDDAILALAGPLSASILDALGASHLSELGYFGSDLAKIADITVRAVRMSYVGEAGFEISCAAADAAKLYDALFERGGRPAGLFAQTSMRIEKRFLAYGHDLDSDVTPLEAGLDFALDWQKDFIGRDGLRRRHTQTPAKSLVTIVVKDEQAAPLGNEPVYYEGSIIGKTTSAAFGYRVGKPLALAYVDIGRMPVSEGAVVEIDIAGTRLVGCIRWAAAFNL